MMSTVILAAAAAAATTSLATIPADAELAATETRVQVSADATWDAVRDVYHVDTRLVPGMVTVVRRDGDTRAVTFANGYTVHKRIVAINDRSRRVTYAAYGGRSDFHLATMEVLPDGSGASRIVWRTYFRPASLRPMITGNMEAGSQVMKRHLEAQATPVR